MNLLMEYNDKTKLYIFKNIIIKFLQLIFCVGFFAFVFSETKIHAEFEELYASDMDKYIDLDGDGKTEKISIDVKIREEQTGYSTFLNEPVYESGVEKVIVYINGKKSYELKYTGVDWYNYQSVNCYICDLNPADNFKEIYVYCWYNETMHRNAVLRYADGNLKMLFKTDLVLCEKQKKNNKVLCYDGDGYVESLGRISPVYEYKIKNKKLKLVTKKNATVTNGNKNWYTVASSIKVYNNLSDKKVIKTLYSGDEFTVTKFRLVKGKITYAYIDTLDEKNVGWIDLRQDNIVENPGLAG